MNKIVYHPPKAVSHGHGPKARSARKAWETTHSFLREHTDFTLRAPLKLTIWGPSEWTERAVVEAARIEAGEAFGPATSISGEFHTWELPVESLAQALEFAFADEDRPKQQLGPVKLYTSFSFEWKVIQNSTETTEHFGKGNRLGVSVGGRRVFIQPTFLFAASDQDPQFVRRLQSLEAAMPFVPNDSYYYRIEPKKTGKGEKLVKLGKGWKSAA